MATRTSYRRLTGRRRTPLGYSQLWLAPDHILLVKSTRFIEYYQRFALADIQAIVVTELADRTAMQIAMAGAAVLWTLVALAVSSMFAKGFFMATGALGIAIVIADIARGPRCRCHLHTAVTRELLGPVSRVRSARVFLAEVRAAIETVQGPVDHIPMEAPSTPIVTDQPPEVPQPPGYLPEILFMLFLLDAVLVLADLRFPHNQIGSALPTTFFAEIVLAVVALVRRAGRDSRRVIYGVMIATLACMGWDAVNLGRSFTLFIMEAARQTRPTPLMSNWEPLAHGEAIFAAAWRIAAGAIGLIFAYLSRTT